MGRSGKEYDSDPNVCKFKDLKEGDQFSAYRERFEKITSDERVPGGFIANAKYLGTEIHCFISSDCYVKAILVNARII